MKEDLENALSVNSRKQYSKYWQQFKRFIKSKFNFLPPCQINSNHIQLFMTYLHRIKNLTVSTIRCFLSAISFKIRSKYDYDPTKSFAIAVLLRSYSKTQTIRTVRKPIDISLLKQLDSHIIVLNMNNYYKILYRTMYHFMYQGLLRVSEVCISAAPHHNLKFNNVHLNEKNSTIKLKLESYKFSSHSCKVVIHCSNELLSIFKKYVKLRGKKNGLFFCHPNLEGITRSELANMLKKQIDLFNLDCNEYNTHSFRIGRATDMAKMGYSDIQIAMAGRWESSAFKKYIRPQFIHTGEN